MSRPDYPAILENLARRLDPEVTRRQARVAELADAVENLCLDSDMDTKDVNTVMTLIEEIVNEYEETL